MAIEAVTVGTAKGAGSAVKAASTVANTTAKMEGVAANTGKEVAKSYSKKTFNAFEKTLKEHGAKSLEKSMKKIEKNLLEHQQKLDDINKNGGYGSSVEREIRTFKGQLDAIKDVLEKNK